jgi:hypothetical protein
VSAQQGDLVGGRYRLVARLVAGTAGTAGTTYGELWRARDEADGRNVALCEVTADGVAQAREVVAAAERLRGYPGLVPVVGLIEGSGAGAGNAVAAGIGDADTVAYSGETVEGGDGTTADVDADAGVDTGADTDADAAADTVAVPSMSGTTWLLLDYVPGRSLAAAVAEWGPLPYPQVVTIAARLVEAFEVVGPERAIRAEDVLLADDARVLLWPVGVGGGTGAASGAGLFSLGEVLFLAAEGRLPSAAAGTGTVAQPQLAPLIRDLMERRFTLSDASRAISALTALPATRTAVLPAVAATLQQPIVPTPPPATPPPAPSNPVSAAPTLSSQLPPSPWHQPSEPAGPPAPPAANPWHQPAPMGLPLPPSPYPGAPYGQPYPPPGPQKGTTGRTVGIVLGAVALVGAVVVAVILGTKGSGSSDTVAQTGATSTLPTPTSSFSYPHNDYTVPSTSESSHSPATDPSTSSAYVPPPALSSSYFDPSGLNEQGTDKTPATVDAFMPQSFVDDKNVEYTLRAGNTQGCTQSDMSDNVKDILNSNSCAQEISGSYVDDSDQYLVAVKVFVFADQHTAKTVYDGFSNEKNLDFGLWCPLNGVGSAACNSNSDYRTAVISQYSEQNHRYVIASLSLAINLSQSETIRPWVESAAKKVVDAVGPQNWSGNR